MSIVVRGCQSGWDRTYVLFLYRLLNMIMLKLNSGNGGPLRKGEMPMYVTYSDLIQLGIFLVALIGLVYKISHKDKK